MCFSLGLRSLFRNERGVWEVGYSMGLLVREATLPSSILVRLRSLVMMPLVMSWRRPWLRSESEREIREEDEGRREVNFFGLENFWTFFL